MAGDVDAGFKTYVNTEKPELNTYFINNLEFKDPYTGDMLDFVHMAVALNVYMYNATTFPHNMIDDDYSGWAGDLQTFINDLKKAQDTKGVLDEDLQAYADNLIGSSLLASTFNIGDMLADVDAVNLNTIDTKNNFYNSLYSYYSKASYNRYADFVDNLGGESSFKTKVTAKTTGEVLSPILQSGVTTKQKTVGRDSFIDFILMKTT